MGIVQLILSTQLARLSISARSLHDHLLEAAVKPQMLTQTSHQARATTFGIHRYGTIFNGVAVKNLEKDDVAGRLMNEAAARHIPAGDKEVGCKVVTLTTESKSLLSYAFGSKATVTTFNRPAFDNGEYSCHGISLERAIPRPLIPSNSIPPRVYSGPHV